jgi:hypothetical protein
VEGCQGMRSRDCAGMKEVVERADVEGEVSDFADAARRRMKGMGKGIGAFRRFDAAVLGCHRDLANEDGAAVEGVVDVLDELRRLNDIAEVLVVDCTAVLDPTLDISELGSTLVVNAALVVITLVALSLDIVITTDTVLLIIPIAVVVVVLIHVTNWPPNRVSLHPYTPS